MKTESETLFEALCDACGLAWEPIPRSPDRTPDYGIVLDDHQVIAEVKQFDPNPEEKSAAPVQGGAPGDRIRKAIQRAAPQLKALSRGAIPTMVVVYNNTDTRLHTDPYAVATAMQGLDVVPVEVPADVQEIPRFGQPRSGPKRKMTPDANTTISAIAVLTDDPRMTVFHNHHARNPIDPDWLRRPEVSHYRWRDRATSSLGDPWISA